MPDDASPLASNRAFLYGDGVFETMKVADGRLLFSEDHYFRLMSAMRILRMEIPMYFSPEFFENQVLSLVEKAGCAESARVRLTVFRNSGGFYLPQTREVSFLATASPLANKVYSIPKSPYEVEIFKDFFIESQLLSTIKSTNRIINITGSIYADENGYDNCLLLNGQKNVVEALQGNVFLLTDGRLVTPPISEGCINGVMRKQVLAISKKLGGMEVVEAPISPFELQKADELFITNVIKGIQPVTRYRKKDYASDFSARLTEELNAELQLS